MKVTLVGSDGSLTTGHSTTKEESVMFGMTMRIESDGLGVTLRACRKEELTEIVPGFSSMLIHMYTTQLFAQTIENE